MPPTMVSPPGNRTSLRDELRLHSRYIRDTLVPALALQPNLSRSDSVLLRSIFKALDTIPVTLDLLRYSRIEKALMVIAAMGTACWPLDVLVNAEDLIAKWEDELGPLVNLRADLYGPGGRMEGVRKMTWKDQRAADDVRPVATHLRCSNNNATESQIGLVCRRITEAISSTCHWPPRL